MSIRIGINGFGRIGRTVMRILLTQKQKDFQIVHINDLTDPATTAHLLKYDSVHGGLSNTITPGESSLIVDGQTISISAIRSPAEIPWKEKKVDIVFECTGIFRKKKDVEDHMKAGAPRVLISAPAVGEDLTVVYGVNHDQLKSHHTMVSNGSCTTNCLAPPTKIIHEAFTILSAAMTTIHSYTNDQSILDLPHSDLRRARAAALSMIPTSTGAAQAIGLVLPSLKGKIDGIAVRVPTPNVSLVDATYFVNKPTTAAEVNDLLKKATQGSLKNIMDFTMEPLVSIDFNGNPHSSIVDGAMTKVLNGTTIKILAWYDNEVGFSHRMLDVAKLMVS